LPSTVFKKGQYIGEKNLRWKGGGWLYWRKQALIRDDYTCRECGLRDPEIVEADHIIPILSGHLDEKRNAKRLEDIAKNGISNLQTLCPNCHKRKTVRQAKSTNSHQ